MQFDIFPVPLRISAAWIACVQFVIDCCLYTLNTFNSMPVEMHQYIRIISSVCVSVFHVDGVHGVALVLNHFSRKFCMQNCVHVFFFFLYCLDSTSRTNNIEHEKSGCFTNSFFFVLFINMEKVCHCSRSLHHQMRIQRERDWGWFFFLVLIFSTPKLYAVMRMRQSVVQ